jgi:hypothetical protein
MMRRCPEDERPARIPTTCVASGDTGFRESAGLIRGAFDQMYTLKPVQQLLANGAALVRRDTLS